MSEIAVNCINLKRVDQIVETSFRTCKCCGNPLPSWVELSLSDFCTRRCVFCPKGNDLVAPNQKLFMPIGLLEKISSELESLEFSGTVTFCGYGEPLASPYLIDAIKLFTSVSRLEVTTNGDLLTEKKVEQIFNAGAHFILVSLYQGPEQVDHFKNIFKNVGIKEEQYCLRDRWYDVNSDFGVVLTNRAGTVNVGKQEEVKHDSQCFYPHYSMTVDWNGDVFLCPQDWHRRIKCGNISCNTIHDVWMGHVFKKYRQMLFEGKRSSSPCDTCNCKGIRHGKTHAQKWNEK